MLLLLPVGIVFFFVVAVETRAFPLYIQERGMSPEAKRFRIYKLRTMRERRTLAAERGAAAIFSRCEDAEYVPPFCTWLRLTGLDELPQLWNIIAGDMSFVGPTPLALSDLAAMKNEYPLLYGRRASLKSKAGLSGMWQLFGSRAGGVEDLVRLDSLYDRTRSFRRDVSLLIKTIPTVLFALRSDAIVKKRRTKKGATKEKEKATHSIPAHEEDFVAASFSVLTESHN